jgi:hypothetical protein
MKLLKTVTDKVQVIKFFLNIQQKNQGNVSVKFYNRKQKCKIGLIYFLHMASANRLNDDV